MSYHSLPLERSNAKIPTEYCYLTIVKYTDNNFTPSNGKKKLTSDELKRKNDSIQNQNETIKRLDSGHFNAFNNKIDLESIYNTTFVSNMDNDNCITYKIKPLASSEEHESYSYSNVHYRTTEFDVVAKLKSKEEILNQIHKDYLLDSFSATIFETYSYANEGYDLKLYEYFKYINETFKDVEISLSDIMLTDDYNHYIRSRFSPRDINEVTKKNIRYLLDNNLVKHFKQYDYHKDKLIIGLIECGLYDVAIQCIKLLDEKEAEGLKKNKDFESSLKKWSTNEEVKEIIKVVNIKLSGLTLTVKKNGSYGNDKIIETKEFNNIGEVKSYLIKQYDIPFEKLSNKDISNLEYYSDDEDSSYEFEVV